MIRPLMLCAVIAIGCAPTRDEAPEDIDGVLSWMYRNFEDQEALAEGFGTLSVWLSADGRTEVAEAGLRLTTLAAEDVADVDTPPGTDISLAVGVAAGSTSPYPIEDHAALLIEADQTFLDPRNYPRYTREITEGDSAVFGAGSGFMRTLNDIERRNVGVSIPFLQDKDYRWVEVEGGRGIVARSWIGQSSCSNGGDNCVIQGYAVDVFWDDGQGDTVRFTTSWSEIDTLVDGILSDDQEVALAVNGILEIYENTDIHLERLAEGA